MNEIKQMKYKLKAQAEYFFSLIICVCRIDEQEHMSIYVPEHHLYVTISASACFHMYLVANSCKGIHSNCNAFVFVCHSENALNIQHTGLYVYHLTHHLRLPCVSLCRTTRLCCSAPRPS